MLLNLSWLREFVPFAGTAEELGDKLTMVGLELDGLHRPFEAVKPIVIGHVVECAKHPEADKLSVCRVDVGDEILDIVCGAPNVALGQKVPVAKVGVTMPGGLLIKKAKLRGAPSHGMICSERELGLSEDHEGIMVLDAGAPVGKSLVDYLGIDFDVLDVAITPNRGDCLSVLGIARDAAVALNLPLTMPSFKLTESGRDSNSELKIKVASGDLCPLYQGRIIEGVKPGKSPAWLRYRLQSIGVRPISNIVDVTNYVLMELGQPLHAFDLDLLRGGLIKVECAGVGEIFTTLDGQERKLLARDITIRDAERAIALGGVMGGLNSEVTAKTSRVFLEAAIFSPSNIRFTSKRLALHSEAAYRFERCVDQQGCTLAMNRAAAMIAEVAGGTVRAGVVCDEPKPFAPVCVNLRQSRAEDLLGVPLETAFCEKTLTGLGCALKSKPGQAWDVTPPSWRPDLTREADLIEEVARIYGVDKIPPVLPAITPDPGHSGAAFSGHDFRLKIKNWAAGLGLNEAINYSFVGQKDLDHLELPEQGRMYLQNPLSDELNVLRPVLAPGLLQSLRNNLAQGCPGVRLFEIACAFTADASSETTAREVPHFAICLYGQRHDRLWPNFQEDMDYQDAKGIVEHLLRSLDLPNADYQTSAAQGFVSPCVSIVIGNQVLGYIGRLKPAMAHAFHAKKPVWLAELDLNLLRRLYLAHTVKFSPLPVYPPIRRDITFAAAPSVTSAQILAEIAKLKLSLLQDVSLIDCYAPKDDDKKRLTYRLTFRHAERTLTDTEVDKQRDLVAQSLPKALDLRV